MALAVFYSSLNPSTSLFSRTQIPFSLAKDFSEEFLPSLHFKSRPFEQYKRKRLRAALAETPAVATATRAVSSGNEHKKLKILIAGGGIGGLVFALAAKKKGFDVVVFERDLSAIRGEGQYRGPIQIQSNALGALEAIDLEVAEEVMKAGCITGDRINGLVDGISGSWYSKFDTFTPAVERGLPVTRVISRLTLQEILANAVGEDIIMNGSNVIDFEDNGNKVTVILENGQRYEGDLLVGADGIRSKVRKSLFGSTEPSYSGYTCYSGIADFVPPDIETVGYRVFLGHKQYFVSSDVGAGKMQWYAFHNEPPGGVDVPNGQKKRLLEIFGDWCDNVVDLLNATSEDAILRRDIYDRIPIFTWGKGRVTLLGDSVHAMQPNLGQGGCMAIEDSYQLALELEKAWRQSIDSGSPIDITSSIQRYEKERRLRVAVIYGMARMAAIMATTYKPYLGVGLGPLSFLTKFRIPHPGRVGGRFFINMAMPLTLNWVLGGNSEKLEGRPPSCRISDKASDQLQRWFKDDDALERALNGEWFLFPSNNEFGSGLQPIRLSRHEDKPCLIGKVSHADAPGTSIAIPSPLVSEPHASISSKDGAFYITDLQSEYGTWITDIEGRRYRIPPNFPTRVRPSDVIQFGSEKVALRVKVLNNMPENADTNQDSSLLQAA
ncbi:Zeaxanthin epoxidase protein [Thalictrum thalictroides]|uniref:Zeaxanthin epoxidase, chloroplastic n=1 Tax=Thalictrum thalictroides TaxID=46969 RepID=A0A7J6VUE1_THATH|nr:Zeaxanthin epoxidase protein [Thalictrum thalictroides]